MWDRIMLRMSQLKALALIGLFFSAHVFADQKDVTTATANKTTAAQAAKDSATDTATTDNKAGPASKAVSVPPGAPLSSATCTPCHAADGNADSPTFPKLSGLASSYIIKELQEFKKGPSGHRNNPVMLTIANQLSDQDMQDLAEYYAKQVRTVGVASASNVELGQRIYRSGNLKTGVTACAACHLPDGSGNELAGFPRLSGQNPQYITEQLNAFKSGDRTNDLNGIMQGIAARMSEDEIEAVSNYVSGLH